MRQTRIVMLAPFGIKPKGTLLARMLPLAQSLVRRSHSVTIVAPPVQNPEDAGTRVVYDGVPVIHTSVHATVLGYVQELLDTSLKLKPDLLHLFKPKGYSGLAARAIKLLRPNMPFVMDSDDWEGWGGWNDQLPYPYPAKLLFAWQERDLPRRADVVTVASRTLQTQAWGFGVAPERVVYVPNGVEAARQPVIFHEHVAEKTHPKLLLYTRFWEFDLHMFVQMLVAIHNQRPDVTVTVLGKGERGEEIALLQLAKRAGIHGMVEYLGWVEPHAIPHVLASADVALAPLDDTLINRARGMAKLLELMQAGMPIVAHNVGAAGEYIQHGHSGMLVPPGDTAAFTHVTLELLQHRELRMRLGQGAQQRVNEHYNWDRLVLAVERAYEMACHATKHGV